MNLAAVVSINESLIHNLKFSFLANFSHKNPFFAENLCQNISVDKIKRQKSSLFLSMEVIFRPFLRSWRFQHGVTEVDGWLCGSAYDSAVRSCLLFLLFCHIYLLIYFIFDEISVKRRRTKTRNRTSRSRTLRLLSISENRYRHFPFFF